MSNTADSSSQTKIEVDASAGKKLFFLREIEKELGYVQAVRAGNTIYISGTVSADCNFTPTAVGDMAGQVRNVYADIARSLEAMGATLSNVVRENLITTDLNRFLAEGAAVRKQVYAGHSLPTSGAWSEVQRLALPEALFEADVIAVVPDGKL